MRKLVFCCGSLSFVLVLAGCPKKKGDEAADAAAEAGPAPTAAASPDDAAAAPAAPAAKNAGDVARFATETKLEDDDVKVAVATLARQSPRGGAVIATLKGGMDVVKIAEHQDCVLVTFADPKDANVTLMGWIGKESFTLPVAIRDAGAKDAQAPTPDAGAGPNCAAGSVAVLLATGNVCKKKCAKDADCKGAVPGSCAPANAGGKVVRVCAAE